MIAYTLSSQLGDEPPSGTALEYVLGAGGVYVRAAREGLRALVRISSCEVRGLPEVMPKVELTCPRVPCAALAAMLARAREVCTPEPREVLFHLWVEEGAWRLVEPDQEATRASVRPRDTGVGNSHHRALVEIHSHHSMAARFSATDDLDEASGFRVFGVLGSIFERPELTLRVGVHGYFWPVPIAAIFEVSL